MNKYSDFSKMTKKALLYEISIQKSNISSFQSAICDCKETIEAMKEAIQINNKYK